MRSAGFVLAGGRSTRMGRDKALLPFQGATLLETIASKVRVAAGSVHVIGSSALYGQLGYPVQEDDEPGLGPVGAVTTLLRLGLADWNLVAACDLPLVTAAFLAGLVDAAPPGSRDRGCVVPVTRDGRYQPLCAVYHASCLPDFERALAARKLKMMDLIEGLDLLAVPVADAGLLRNANTPAEWAALRGERA